MLLSSTITTNNKRIRKSNNIYYCTILLFLIAFNLIIGVSGANQNEIALQVAGSISYLPLTTININENNVIGENVFSTGFQIDYPWEWQAFRDRSSQQNLARDANFKLVRVFERHWGSLDYSQGVGACSYWNEATQTGVFDWSNVDSVVRAIYNSGAEPLICLSAWTEGGEKPTVPPGMAVDPVTRLPYPESYANFARVWVQHFIDVGIPVRYYEIFNEIETYIGWNWGTRNEARVAYFIDLFNAAYLGMHDVNDDIIVSFDASTLTFVFPRLLSHGVGIDSFNFHKYDDWQHEPAAFSDDRMFQRAEDVYFQVQDQDTYTIDYVRNTWYAQRGEYLPVILSEGNWNAVYGPTDDRIQEIAGAVRMALVFRMCMLHDVSYNIFYTFTSDSVWEKQTYGGGNGFGMIDSDTRHSTSRSYDDPWYPYYLHLMFGPELNVGDDIIDVRSSSSDVRSIGWINGETTNILLIHKDTGKKAIKFNGLEGELIVKWLDGTISYENPSIQSKRIDAELGLNINGYTVMLIQTTGHEFPEPPAPPLPQPSGSWVLDTTYDASNGDTFEIYRNTGTDLYAALNYPPLSGITYSSRLAVIEAIEEIISPTMEFIVDDTEVEYVGIWDSSSITDGYYGSGYRYHAAGSGSNSATWTIDITTVGSYEIYARWTSGSNRATDAPYRIYYAGTSTIVDVNQQINGGEWFSLGVYNFNVGSYGAVLSDNANGIVIADAIKVVER